MPQQLSDIHKEITRDLVRRLESRFQPTSVLCLGDHNNFISSCFSCGTGLVLTDPPELYDLISVIHYAPLETATGDVAVSIVQDLIDHLKLGGNLFIRTTNFSLKSALSKLYIFDEWVQSELGQVDYICRQRQPITLSCCVIAHNEEKVIGRMLDSVALLASELIVYLNNSTDGTRGIIEEFANKTGIQTTILDGYWNDDFARARNESLKAATGSHVFWMDCDDVLDVDAPPRILNKLEDNPDSPQSWKMFYGNDILYHCRLWANKVNDYKPHFHGSWHEVVHLGGFHSLKQTHNDIVLYHKPVPHGATDRNYRIGKKAMDQGPRPCQFCLGKQDERGRTLFYFGNAAREFNKPEEAIAAYREYLDNNHGWHDEQFWAHMYAGHCYMCLSRPNEGLREFFLAMAKNINWSESYMALARFMKQQGRYQEAIAWAAHAPNFQIPQTGMWVNKNDYKDQPYRLITNCLHALGDIDAALVAGEKAAEMIGGPDQQWQDYLNSIKAIKGKKIAQVMRPGALGDILMSTAACKGLKEQGYHVRYVCCPGSHEILMDNPYIDEVMSVNSNRWEEMENTPGPKADKFVRFEYPMIEGYPDTPMSRHLAHIFCEQAGVEPTTHLSVGLTQEQLDYGAQHGSNKILIHTTAGWSPLKNWAPSRWQELVDRITKELSLEVIQIGGSKDPEVPGATKLNTPTVRHAIAVQKFCLAFVGIDSVFNHSSQAVNKRSVIIWGSTHPRGSGYQQNINIVAGGRWTPNPHVVDQTLPCQPCYKEFNRISAHPKPPCTRLQSHNETFLPLEDYPINTITECQSLNTVDIVFNSLKDLLK